jgi:hypothetical protein
MRFSSRLSLLILLLGFFFFLGILFRSYLLDYFVTPVAVVLLVFWRIVLSVHQAIYWGILIFSASFYALLRLSQRPVALEQTSPPLSNATLDNINYWRTSILLTLDEIEKPNVLRRNLGTLLAEIVASKQPGTTQFEIYDALKLHQIPLPEPIYAFVFPVEPSPSRRSFKQVLQSIQQTPSKWVRRWTGRDVAEYYQSIQDVLAFMESSLEIKHDDGPFDAPNH